MTSFIASVCFSFEFGSATVPCFVSKTLDSTESDQNGGHDRRKHVTSLLSKGLAAQLVKLLCTNVTMFMMLEMAQGCK